MKVGNLVMWKLENGAKELGVICGFGKYRSEWGGNTFTIKTAKVRMFKRKFMIEDRADNFEVVL